MAEYTGLNFFEVAELNYVQYLIWRRDAFIQWLSSSEWGQQYLDKCWRMEQTSPDRERLRKVFRREG